MYTLGWSLCDRDVNQVQRGKYCLAALRGINRGMVNTADVTPICAERPVLGREKAKKRDAKKSVKYVFGPRINLFNCFRSGSGRSSLFEFQLKYQGLISVNLSARRLFVSSRSRRWRRKRNQIRGSNGMPPFKTSMQKADLASHPRFSQQAAIHSRAWKSLFNRYVGSGTPAASKASR
jgi:hypothetical protein